MISRLGILLGLVLFPATLPFLLGCLSCGPSGPPEPTTCDRGAPAGVVTMLELGSSRGPFVPSANAAVVRGGQGSDMLSFRVAVQSTNDVSCISQRMVIDGRTIDRPLVVSRDGDWFVSDPILAIPAPSATLSIHVRTEAYGFTVERDMRADLSDAGTRSVDAGDGG